MIIFIILKILTILIPLLLSIAYTTLLERKLIATFQRRKGPNVIGIYGLLQPLADGLKLLLKETVIPNYSNITIFLLAPIVTFMLSLISWAVIPFQENIVFADINIGILFIFAISSLGVYGIIMSGWASNSKYALLGALRCAAQMISYEVSIGLIVMTILACTQSLNLTEIVMSQVKVWYIIPLFPSFLLFFVSSLAETNRAPFDLPEAEAELVSGYNVEYSAMGFALFFLGEYSHIILMSALNALLFLGGWLPIIDLPFIPHVVWFALKTIFFIFVFIWVRSTFPRYRYDQLMRLGWKVFLPLSLGWLLVVTYLVAHISYVIII
jgi:NADH-quinone oxidoreductase subunit H